MREPEPRSRYWLGCCALLVVILLLPITRCALQGDRLLKSDRAIRSGDDIAAAMGRAEPDYYNWRRTPLDVAGSEHDWAIGREDAPVDRKPRIARYLSKYANSTTLPPTVEKLIDDMIASPGSFHASRPGGALIVVSPRRKRIAFAYSG